VGSSKTLLNTLPPEPHTNLSVAAQLDVCCVD
jgi:hypothetical protein